jgi:hypothetical protein
MQQHAADPRRLSEMRILYGSSRYACENRSRRLSVNPDDHQSLVEAIEDNPIARQLPLRPTFIPLRHADLRQKLVELLPIEGNSLDAAAHQHICQHLKAIFHVEHLTILQQLEDRYSHLDPDSELLDLSAIDDDQRKQLADGLIDQVSDLLANAHYKQLSRAELEAAIEIGCQWGVRLDVDFELFDRLEIFARGYQTVTIRRRRWQNLYREEEIELPEFQRLIMVFRIQPPPETPEKKKKKKKKKKKADEDSLKNHFVYLKTFKNIPETDLEILLPGSRIRLTRFDRVKILLPTLSGTFITAYKLFRSMVVLSLAITVGAILGWIVFLGAMIGYIIKSFLSYFRTKSKYQFDLTKSLYLKNLDNNLSVIYRIMNEAEEQEYCEAMLAYTLLWKHEEIPEAGIDSEGLDQIAESFLAKVTNMDVDFEVDDALAKCLRLGMATMDAEGRWKAVSSDRTLESLSNNWSHLLKSTAGLGDDVV